MNDFEKIKTAFERQSKAVTLRPGMGQGTAVTRVRISDGLTCEIVEGDWKLTADMSVKWGGNDAGPNPGVIGRGALGSCLAMAYMMWAARLGVSVTSLDVEIHAGYDTRGMCGVEDSVPAGYTGIRYVVNIESPAPREDVLRVLDAADARCSYLDNFARAVPMEREVQINGSKE
jgi:uncharacterized OsmC-like protein